jgi:hypothetical protein
LKVGTQVRLKPEIYDRLTANMRKKESYSKVVERLLVVNAWFERNHSTIGITYEQIVQEEKKID